MEEICLICQFGGFVASLLCFSVESSKEKAMFYNGIENVLPL